jgi:hypothetical protein
MGSACGKHGHKRTASKVLVGKRGRKNFVRLTNRQENIIKMFLQSYIRKIYNWFFWVRQGACDKRCANVGMKTMILEIAQNFLISWATIGLSARTVLLVRKLQYYNTFQPFLYSRLRKMLSVFSKNFSTLKDARRRATRVEL